MSENRVPRNKFALKIFCANGGFRSLCNAELHDLQLSLNTINVTKSRIHNMQRKDDKYANGKPATHLLDLSPFHIGSLLNMPLQFFYLFLH
jgi:hypothetical protein